MTLESYKKRRRFQKTPEPPPEKKEGKGPLTFVVQKHLARRLHYDLRLELDGVLKSWAVPKGPSMDPADKHLAVMVEDHPVEYASFEGNIPEGEYGAGEVIVWDSGTYSPDEGGKLLFHDRAAAEKEMREGIANGKLSFFLRGQKLKGSFTLVKLKNEEKDWLLMKHRDEYADPSSDVLEKSESVATARTVEDVKLQRPPHQKSAEKLDPKDVPGVRKATFPPALSPMLATLSEGGPFSGPDWYFEPKLDGYRIISFLRGGKVKLFTRNRNDVTAEYSVIVPDLERQPASELVLDGEIIALDEKGKQCFQCLQNYLRAFNLATREKPPYPLVYYVFDILYLDGYDLRGAELRHRKEILNNVFRPADQVRLIDYFENDGETLFKAAVKNGLEGVMAKRVDSVYETGRRSKDWLKIKAMKSDEFIIGGYSVDEKKGRKETFSSLILGQYDSKGKLIYSGNVGSGFDEHLLADLKKRLDALCVQKSPFLEPPRLNASTTWVKPELVAEVKYAERTQDGRLRIPVFLRLREDKAPRRVRREKTISVPDDPPPKKSSGALEKVLEQLKNAKDTLNLEVEGAKIAISNLDKVLWPKTSGHPPVTKRLFLTYLAEVSPHMLPHLKDRPLTMTRYPDGITGEHFYQKHWSSGPAPEYVNRVNIREEQAVREYLVCDNLATLLWLGQLGNIEFHTWFSRIIKAPDMKTRGGDIDDILDRPDFIVFDLDPYIYSGREKSGEEPELNHKGFEKTCEVALWLKETLDELGLDAFIKTSGKTGLHIYVPIIRKLDYKAARSAAEKVGRFLLQRHPGDITMEWAVEKRTGKIFVDYGQNVRGKTLASVYSPRPASGATVSTPLKWDELGKVFPEDFTMLNLPARLKKTGDLWSEILSSKSDLGELLKSSGKD
ncbi:MAG TPA: DNA ligase D [Dehalococcoidales bacterium]|nr:DNA ligase D [Dehalococcoidales bacterium]